MSELKEKFIEYLEANELAYIDRGSKVSHSCISIEHNDTKPSAFTTFSEGKVFCYCKGCGYVLTDEAFYNFLDVGFDKNTLLKSQINSIFKEADNKNLVKFNEKEHTKIYLPIKDKDFIQSYRGISAEVFAEVGAYSTMKDNYYGKRIIFPIYNYKNELISFEAVSTSNKVLPKILRPKNTDMTTLFGFENLITQDTVAICEGIFNSLSFKTLGYDSIFNFGLGNINQKIRTLLAKGVKNLILVGDNDKVGREFNKHMFKLLRNNFNVGFFQYPYQFKDKGDVNDLLREDREVFQGQINKTLSKMMVKI